MLLRAPLKIDPDVEVQLEKPLLQSAMYIKGRGRKSDSRRFYTEDCGTPAPQTPSALVERNSQVRKLGQFQYWFRVDVHQDRGLRLEG